MLNILSFTRRSDLTFCRSGRIYISARVVRILGLNSGDSINITCQDGEFLIFAVSALKNPAGANVAACRPSNKKGMHFYCNCAKLAKAMLRIANVKTDRVSFFVGYPTLLNGTKALPIITKNPIV